MGGPSGPQSALQSFINTHRIPTESRHAVHLHQLALQIAHNLRYQHGWTDVRIHYESAESAESSGLRVLPRPIVSGLPPQRLYVHPDEQIELLQKQKDRGKSGMPDLEREREWVLPSHLREKWSLKRFGEVFDAVSSIPAEQDGHALFKDIESSAKDANGFTEVEADDHAHGSLANKWRAGQPKRMLLATLGDDSTIVYYIVHDGIVKPRQN